MKIELTSSEINAAVHAYLLSKYPDLRGRAYRLTLHQAPFTPEEQAKLATTGELMRDGGLVGTAETIDDELSRKGKVE